MYLIAILEVIERLEKDQVIKITRISGTSAGAIAAALYAAKLPMIQVKERLKAFRLNVSKFPQPGKVRTAYNLLRGKAIATQAPIEEVLSDLFTSAKVTTVGDLKIKTLIMSADLFTGKTHISEDDENIVTALLDSSAIPIYFRVWNSDRRGLVDGGICENLPIPPKDKDFGPIVGVSFNKQQVKTIKGPVVFLKTLLDTAIQNSVERARQELGASVMPISSSIGTFEFEKALSDSGGLGAEYDLTKHNAELWLKKYIESNTDISRAPANIDLWESQNSDTMRRLGNVYAKQHENSKYFLKRSSFVVFAHCLLQPHEPLQGPDLVRYQLVFETLDEPIYCQSLALTIAEDSKSRGMATVQIVGPNPNAPITPTLIPIITPTEAHRLATAPINAEKVHVRELAVFFDPVLPPHTGPYTLTLEEWVDNVMAPLQKKGADNLFIRANMRAKGTVHRIDLVLNVPKSFGLVHASPLSAPNQPVQMTSSMVADYAGPGGIFNTIGWTCPEAAPNESVAISLRRV